MIVLKPEALSLALEIASGVLTLVVAVFHGFTNYKARRGNTAETDAMTILARAAGVAILPQALLIIYGTFDPSLLCSVQGLRAFFMLSGLSLIFICVKALTT